MNTKVASIIIIIVLIAGSIFFFKKEGSAPVTDNMDMSSTTDTSDTSAFTPVPVTTPTQATTTTPVTTQATKEFTVTGSNFAFSPSTITVNKGDKVRIIFKNSGGMHDWVLDEFNAKTNIIQGGQSQTIEFTADKSGTFEYYCSVGTHRQMGMKGTLTVK